MTPKEVRERLFALQDEKYKAVQIKRLPGLNAKRIIGVRTEEIRSLARELVKSGKARAYFSKLPHEYFEEDHVHALALSQWKDWKECLSEIKRFLPHVDNWVICDQISPIVFKWHDEKLMAEIKKWIKSEHTYTVRFAIKMLMDHYLGAYFSPSYAKMVAGVPAGDYYIDRMAVQYFCAALAKNYDEVLPLLEKKKLAPWVHQNTITRLTQSSSRVTPEQKEYLRSLRLSKNDS